MMWFKSYIKPLGKDNPLSNKQSMVAETLAAMVLFYRRDTTYPRNFTSNTAENTFVSMRLVMNSSIFWRSIFGHGSRLPSILALLRYNYRCTY